MRELLAQEFLGVPVRGGDEISRPLERCLQVLDLAWVAAGRLDGYWERSLSPWDMAAGIALVREAGGFITDLDGCEEMIKTGGILAGNEDIHREMLRALKEAQKAPSIAQRSTA